MSYQHTQQTVYCFYHREGLQPQVCRALSICLPCPLSRKTVGRCHQLTLDMETKCNAAVLHKVGRVQAYFLSADNICRYSSRYGYLHPRMKFPSICISAESQLICRYELLSADMRLYLQIRPLFADIYSI